ncbi:phosphatidylglycerol lysyltransferase domain-containing protein [Leifsonia sp. RAF41]|uniref:phosphatidylglycerol lysyltransferase domain-containing protein n=1 Tax=Leifsonia sp. RAF41 TaxID=3233056 RepID=UPI003F951ED8
MSTPDTASATPAPPTAPTSAPPGGRGGVGRTIARYVRIAPASIALAAIVLVTSIISGTLWGAATTGGDSLVWAAGVTSTIRAAFWWTPFTALFVPEDPAQLIITLVLALTVMAASERLIGTARAVLAFLVTGILAVALGVLLQWAAAGIGELWATVTEFDFTLDPTVGIVGTLMTASAFASSLWRRRIRLLTFAVVLVFVLYNGDQNNVYRLIAALLGLGLGVVLRRGRLRRLRRSSHGETRTLVAAIVAITAFGPLLALLPPGGFGPLSFVAALFERPAVNVAQVLARCDVSYSSNCRSELQLVSIQGPGPLLLSVLPLALLLLAAIGLRRGRRFALLLAIVVNAAMVVLPFTVLGGDIALEARSMEALWPALEVLLWLLAAVLVPIALIALLIATRSQFQLRSPREAIVRFGIVVVCAFALLALAYLIAALWSLTEFVPDATVADAFASTLRRFVPAGFLSVLGTPVIPTTSIVVLLYQWVGPAFWVVFVFATLQLYRSSFTGRTLADEEHFRALLRDGGGGTLGFMGTWPGNVYWFSSDGESAIAYRVINGIAITLSDPVCRPERAERTISEFVQFCDANSWTPVFYSVHGAFLPVFEALGWPTMSVGEETLMHPQTFDLVGKPWQKVRQAHNRGIKARISTLWTSWDDLSPLIQTQITAVSEQWVSEKELPEMGFTLGWMAELKDPDVRLYLAFDPDGGLQAVTSWLPSWRDGRVVGWTIDFMRRADGSMPGIMEFVIASAAQHMRDEGVEVLSLSGAPLATKPGEDADDPADQTAMDRLLALLAHTLEPAYGFASLFAFKSKFNPTYETIYMAYPDQLALPAIGNAIGKAYLPDANAREYVALARTLVR